MNIIDNELRITWYTLKACKYLMEQELAEKRQVLTGTDLARAEQEYKMLTDFYDSVTVEKNKILDIGLFSSYPDIFFPTIK